MDGSTMINVSISEEACEFDSKKAISAAKLAELALIDPKRAKRQLANRSKEREMRYRFELERTIRALQTESTTLSSEITILERDTDLLTAENNKLRMQLKSMEQQLQLQDALKEETQRKKLTGQANVPNQQFYPNSLNCPAISKSQDSVPEAAISTVSGSSSFQSHKNNSSDSSP